MSRYVDIDEITKDIKAFQDSFVVFTGATGGRKVVFTGSPADVRPNIHARWESDGHGHIICSACKEANVSTWKSRFCPMCGARMDGAEPER